MKNQKQKKQPYDPSRVETLSDNDILCALSQVKHSFEPELARDLIEYFHEKIKYGRPFVKEQLINFVEMAFSRMIDSECNADQAFGLEPEKGKYARPDTTDRDVDCAAFMMVLRRLGWTWLDASNEAVGYILQDEGSEKIAQRAFKEYGEELQCLSCEELWEILPSTMPPIQQFIKKNVVRRKDDPSCLEKCMHQRLLS